jgi:hypothetical protein
MVASQTGASSRSEDQFARASPVRSKYRIKTT